MTPQRLNEIENSRGEPMTTEERLGIITGLHAFRQIADYSRAQRPRVARAT